MQGLGKTMTVNTASTNSRPTLYAARSVPYDKLSPDDFEKLIYSLFVVLQDMLHINIAGNPGGSGDGGFDVYGDDILTDRRVCIQCKRLTSSNLGLPTVAQEIAKVALSTKISSADVGAHFFVTSGALTQEIPKLLRETNKTRIINKAKELVQNAANNELVPLRDKIANNLGLDPQDVVEQYVFSLDRLIVWSIDEFDAQLSAVWPAAKKVLERYFQIERVVEEYPRPLFDRAKYLGAFVDYTEAVQPLLEKGSLPVGLAESSASNPVSRVVSERETLLSIEALSNLESGKLALIVAEGGAGKTTVLQLIRTQVAKKQLKPTLPVLISCSDYVKGNLDGAINTQLDISYGSWRQLPDNILLLCDGLNETSKDNLSGLFSELKVLLEKKKVSCILTSREDSRVGRAVLPKPLDAIIRLAHLTPSRVHSLAVQRLADDSDVSRFIDSHRNMAANTRGSLMWTAFSIIAALEYWKSKGDIGSTAGELIKEIISSRAERDLEIVTDASVEIPSASILAFAEALAFEMLFFEHSLSCSSKEIEAVIKRAKIRCSSMLGIDELTSLQLVRLLQKHDFVKRTVDDSFQWNHQLIAGSLAASQLQTNWKEHVKSLPLSLTDDAWIFSAPKLDESELEEYLEYLFKEDLMLGARAIAELPVESRNMGLKYLANVFLPHQPQGLRSTGYFALAKIGTNEAIQQLRSKSENIQTDDGFCAARALAYSGDREYLTKLLKEVDGLKSMPFKSSGGHISIWEAANLADRIQVARDRLQKEVQNVDSLHESLCLVEYERSPNDVPLFQECFQNAKNIVTWHIILRAIFKLSSIKAQSLFDDSVTTNDIATRADMMQRGVKIGLEVNVENALSDLLEICEAIENTSEAEVDKYSDIRNALILGVLENKPLSGDVINLVKEQLENSQGEKRICLFRVASFIDDASIADVAIEAFRADTYPCGALANYFIAQKEVRDKHYDELQGLVDQYIQDESHWFTFDCWRLLALKRELGFNKGSSIPIIKMIEHLYTLHTRCNEPPLSNQIDDSHVQDESHQTSKYEIELFLQFIDEGVIGARHFIPEKQLAKLLHFSPHDKLLPVFHCVDKDILDEELAAISDKWFQLQNLLILSQIEMTDCRLNILDECLKLDSRPPVWINKVKDVIDVAWSPEVRELVIESVARISNVPKQNEQFFNHFIDAIDRKINTEDKELITQALAKTSSLFAERILRIWLESTSDTRYGLSRINND